MRAFDKAVILNIETGNHPVRFFQETDTQISINI